MSRPVVIVLGAGPGVGAAVAHRFARAGYDVGLVGRREEPLAELGRQLGEHGVDTGWATADVGDPASLTTALHRLTGHTGRLDVLHHNVSVYRAATATGTTADQLLADLAVGAASLLTGVRAVLPLLLDDGGTVLATGSGAADRPMTGAASLGAQKATLRNLVLALDAELRPQGVHVATLTVRGVLARGTAFDPERVADSLFCLAAETAGPPEGWRTVVDFPEASAPTS